MIKTNPEDYTRVKYVLSCIYNYGIEQAYNQSNHKDVFKHLSRVYNVPENILAHTLVGFKSMEDYFEDGTSIVAKSELDYYSKTIKASRLLKHAISEYNRSDIYKSILGIYFNINKDAEIDELLSNIVMCDCDGDSNYPYYNHSEGKFYVSKDINLNDLIISIINYKRSLGGELMLNSITQLGIESSLVDIDINVTPVLSQVISMLEYVGLRVCDVVSGILNQDMFPSCEFFITSVKDSNGSFLFTPFNSNVEPFIMHEKVFDMLVSGDKIDSIEVIDNKAHINGMPVSKYLGVANG